MPIYSYKCDACGHEFDLRQGVDSSTEQPCPKCQSVAKRKFLAAGILYKGSGFYTDDWQKVRPSHSNIMESTPSTPPASPPEKEEHPSESPPAHE